MAGRGQGWGALGSADVCRANKERPPTRLASLATLPTAAHSRRFASASFSKNGGRRPPRGEGKSFDAAADRLFAGQSLLLAFARRVRDRAARTPAGPVGRVAGGDVDAAVVPRALY